MLHKQACSRDSVNVTGSRSSGFSDGLGFFEWDPLGPWQACKPALTKYLDSGVNSKS